MRYLSILFLSFVLMGCNTTGSSQSFSELMGGFVDLVLNPDAGDSSAQKVALIESKKMIVVNENVDTVAARLKQRYDFKTEDELWQLSQRGDYGRYQSLALREGKYVWMAMPGASYKMGRTMNKDISLQFDLIKDGANRTKIYIKFWHMPDTLDVEKSYAQIKAAAEGRAKDLNHF